MTYRRLFLWLFTGSTVVLLVIWGVSLFHSTTFRRSPFGFTIIHGTLESTFLRMEPGSHVVLHETPDGGFRKLPDRGMDHPLGRWKATRVGGHFSNKHHPASPPDFSIRTLHVPLWGPWLVFVSCAFVLCKLMERRSASGREKRLAEGG